MCGFIQVISGLLLGFLGLFSSSWLLVFPLRSGNAGLSGTNRGSNGTNSFTDFRFFPARSTFRNRVLEPKPEPEKTERGSGGVRKCNGASVTSERQLQPRRPAVRRGLSAAGSALPGCEDRSAALPLNVTWVPLLFLLEVYFPLFGVSLWFAAL